MTAFSVDPDALETAAGTVKDSADQADEVAEYAREADPDIWMWGIPGTFLAAPYYFMMAEILHSQLEGVRGTIEGYVELVEQCASDYRDADEAAASELNDIESNLEGVQSD